MALRIVTTRLAQANSGVSLPIRTCLSAQMSSSVPTPSTPPKKQIDVTGKIDGTVKKESLLSWLSTLFNGRVQAADPAQGTFKASEVNLPHIVEKATGEDKLMLLAFENGIMDPYCNLPVQRNGRGTKDNPIAFPSFGDERLIACLCERAQSYHKYMTLYRGEKKRCQCGHWMEMTEAPRFWEKIPKDDLLEIKFFRDLEALGKLDEFLKTGKLDKNYHATLN